MKTSAALILLCIFGVSATEYPNASCLFNTDVERVRVPVATALALEALHVLHSNHGMSASATVHSAGGDELQRSIYGSGDNITAMYCPLRFSAGTMVFQLLEAPIGRIYIESEHVGPSCCVVEYLVGVTKIQVGQQFLDPGLEVTVQGAANTEYDSAQVTAYGRSEVSTFQPTPPGEPYVIVYAVQTTAGEMCGPLLRVVEIVCKDHEYLCSTEVSLHLETEAAMSFQPSYFCSASSECSAEEAQLQPFSNAREESSLAGDYGDATVGEDQSLDQSQDRIATLPFGDSTQEASYSSLVKSYTKDYTAPSELYLKGPSTVWVEQGLPYPYALCPPFPPPGRVCDPGATAYHPNDGQLNMLLEACSDPADPLSRHFVALEGLDGCQISTDSPATFTIVYSIRLSDGSTIQTERTVVVTPNCDEHVCMDGATCSNDFFCLDDLTEDLSTEYMDGALTSSSTQLSSSLFYAPSAVPQAADGSILPPCADEESPNSTADNTPPWLLEIRLVGSRTVTVPQGTTYSACGAGEMPSSEHPCDQGAEAFRLGFEDISYRVLSCPVPECMSNGCESHAYRRVGIAPCSVETGDPVGTSFLVNYTVTSQMPARSQRVAEGHAEEVYVASTTREVVIVAPCATDEVWQFHVGSIVIVGCCAATCGHVSHAELEMQHRCGMQKSLRLGIESTQYKIAPLRLICAALFQVSVWRNLPTRRLRHSRCHHPPCRGIPYTARGNGSHCFHTAVDPAS